MALPFNQRPVAKSIFLSIIGLCVFIFTGSSQAVTAYQQQVQGREIISDDFIKDRPAAPESKPASRSNPSGKKKRRVYRFISTQAASAKTAATSPATSRLSAIEQVGITIWRLRPSTAADSGPKIPVRESSGTSWWTPERTRAGVPFEIGDRVRLTIESPRAGYLYVIDREQYADGTLGAPLVIFPTLKARGGNNRVSAGMLIEIPAQDDIIPYFKMTRGRDDQVGEILTVLVTPQPIEGIPLTHERPRLSPQMLAQWESAWGVETELFEIEGAAGVTWTKAEQQAGSFSGRSLTQEEPVPQTIYRVRVKPGNPLLVTVPLRYGPG